MFWVINKRNKNENDSLLKKKLNIGIFNFMEKKRELGGCSYFYIMIIFLRGRVLDKNDIGKCLSFIVENYWFFFYLWDSCVYK